MTDFERAMKGLRVVFAAIPPGKFRSIMPEAQELELGLKKLAAKLSYLRQYYLETVGEESPFVKQIDELVPRT